MSADALAPPPPAVTVWIRSLLPSLPPAERRVAQAVLADPGGVASRSITALARTADTSETTVVRFCRALGVRGYPQLRLALTAEASRGDAARQPPLGGDIGPDDDLATVVAKISSADAGAIKDTAAQLDIAELGRVVHAMAGADRIELFGVGASAAVAADLHAKLRRIGRVAFTSSDAHAALTGVALLGPGSVAAGFSHRGTTRDTVEPLAEARRRGATTVAITNNPRSPITRVADHTLVTAARETTFRSGAMASRLAQLTVVDCLFVGVAQRTYPQTLQALERTFDAVGSATRQRARPWP